MKHQKVWLGIMSLICGGMMSGCAFLQQIEQEIEQEEIASHLSTREECIIKVSAFTARGDQVALKEALREGLDAGVTLAELKEVLTQMYAYCGFPRSLNALNTLMTLEAERTAQGIVDPPGKDASPLRVGSSLEIGTANQTKLVGHPVAGKLFTFAPAIDAYLKAHLFGDIFGRDVLDWRTREMATVAALSALPGVESQLASHIAIAKNNGVTEGQIKKIQKIVHDEVTGGAKTSPFAFGERNDAYAKYFKGDSYLARLTTDKRLNTSIANVTFEPGCRNNWHKHSGGQILIVVGGEGLYQERGKAARRLRPGDVVEIAPNVEHWHGATPDSWFAHLSVECNPSTNQNTWLDGVSSAEYREAATAK